MYRTGTKLLITLYIFLLNYCFSIAQNNVTSEVESRKEQSNKMRPNRDSTQKAHLKIGYRVPIVKENISPTAIHVYTNKYGKQKPEVDCSGIFRLRVSRDSLLIIAEVKDDTVLTDHDAIEIFLIDTLGGNNTIQWIISAPDTAGNCTITEWDFRGSRSLNTVASGFAYKANRIEKGYRIRTSIHLAALDLQAKQGQTFALQLQINDKDAPSDKPWVANWHPGDNTYQNSLAAFPMYIDTARGERVDFSLKAVKAINDEIIFSFHSKKPGMQLSFYENGKKVQPRLTKKDTSTRSELLHIAFGIANRDGIYPIEVRQRRQTLGYFPFPALPYLIDTTQNKVPQLRNMDRLDYIQKPFNQPKGQIVFYGHSYFGYWFTIKEDFKDYKVLNRGLSGSQVQHLIPYTARCVSFFQPSIIVLIIGVNDLNTGDTPENAFNEFKLLTEKLQSENPKASIIVLSHTKFHYKRNQNTKIYDELVAAYVKSKPKCEWVDLSYVLDPEDPNMYDLLLPDKAHLNAKGYTLVAPPIQSAIEKINKKEKKGPNKSKK